MRGDRALRAGFAEHVTPCCDNFDRPVFTPAWRWYVASENDIVHECMHCSATYTLAEWQRAMWTAEEGNLLDVIDDAHRQLQQRGIVFGSELLDEMRRDRATAEEGPPLPGDLVRHCKGGLYRVLMQCRLSDDHATYFLVYVSVGGTLGPHGLGNVWCRRKAEFGDVVTWPDGRQRFRFVSRDLPGLPVEGTDHP